MPKWNTLGKSSEGGGEKQGSESPLYKRPGVRGTFSTPRSRPSSMITLSFPTSSDSLSDASENAKMPTHQSHNNAINLLSATQQRDDARRRTNSTASSTSSVPDTEEGSSTPVRRRSKAAAVPSLIKTPMRSTTSQQATFAMSPSNAIATPTTAGVSSLPSFDASSSHFEESMDAEIKSLDHPFRDLTNQQTPRETQKEKTSPELSAKKALSRFKSSDRQASPSQSNVSPPSKIDRVQVVKVDADTLDHAVAQQKVPYQIRGKRRSKLVPGEYHEEHIGSHASVQYQIGLSSHRTTRQYTHNVVALSLPSAFGVTYWALERCARLSSCVTSIFGS